MRALVVWESAYGNTRQIAESIVEGLAPNATATAVEADQIEAEMVAGADLIVVGAPTHMFGLPRPQSRQSAAQQASGQVRPATSGVREWLAGSPRFGSRTVAAAFDTRFAKPHWLTGSAARAAARRLRTLGCRVIATESFFVTRSEGPLRTGEPERARQWAARLAADVASVES